MKKAKKVLITMPDRLHEQWANEETYYQYGCNSFSELVRYSLQKLETVK